MFYSPTENLRGQSTFVFFQHICLHLHLRSACLLAVPDNTHLTTGIKAVPNIQYSSLLVIMTSDQAELVTRNKVFDNNTHPTSRLWESIVLLSSRPSPQMAKGLTWENSTPHSLDCYYSYSSEKHWSFIMLHSDKSHSRIQYWVFPGKNFRLAKIFLPNLFTHPPFSYSY